jgi:hypothetical protein
MPLVIYEKGAEIATIVSGFGQGWCNIILDGIDHQKILRFKISSELIRSLKRASFRISCMMLCLWVHQFELKIIFKAIKYFRELPIASTPFLLHFLHFVLFSGFQCWSALNNFILVNLYFHMWRIHCWTLATIWISTSDLWIQFSRKLKKFCITRCICQRNENFIRNIFQTHQGRSMKCIKAHRLFFNIAMWVNHQLVRTCQI